MMRQLKYRNMKISGWMPAAAAAVALVLMTGCSKEGPSRFRGNYSYSTSGTVVLASSDDTLTVSVPAEAGQLDIVTADKSSGDMILTMRPVTGGAVVFDANADGRLLRLSPAARRLQVNFGNGVLAADAVEMDVDVSGYGERYSDVIIFRLEYDGTCVHEGITYRITESSVDCVAKENR